MKRITIRLCEIEYLINNIILTFGYIKNYKTTLKSNFVLLNKN